MAGAEEYTLGYGPLATNNMADRTASTHAASILPLLVPGQSVLDVGCGPGSITFGLAEKVAPGRVLGIDVGPSMIERARRDLAARDLSNVTFQEATAYELPAEDDSFDMVVMAALLGNLCDPVRAVREAYRVLKPGGVLAVTEFDLDGDLLQLTPPALLELVELGKRLRRHFGHHTDSGRHVRRYLHSAGFHDIEVRARYDTVDDPAIFRAMHPAFIEFCREAWADWFLRLGWLTESELEEKLAAIASHDPVDCLYATAWCDATGRKPA